MKQNLTNYYKNIVNAKSDTIAWSTFKDFKPFLTDKGRKNTRPLTADERKFPDKSKHLQCFIPVNSRATNMYSDRYNLAYLVNVYPHPSVVKFFCKKDIEVNSDSYALSEMLQWIWRSRIRNGLPVNIYIPSSRMRNLLEQWLEK